MVRPLMLDLKDKGHVVLWAFECDCESSVEIDSFGGWKCPFFAASPSFDIINMVGAVHMMCCHSLDGTVEDGSVH